MQTQGYILGLSTLGHDTSLTVVDDNGSVVVIAEEERYSRYKRGRFVFHPDLIRHILTKYGIDPSQVHTLVVAGQPGADSQSPQLLSYQSTARAEHQRVWISVIKEMFPRLRRVETIRHHRAHAASAFFSSEWDEAAVVTLDGYGDG